MQVQLPLSFLSDDQETKQPAYLFVQSRYAGFCERPLCVRPTCLGTLFPCRCCRKAGGGGVGKASGSGRMAWGVDRLPCVCLSVGTTKFSVKYARLKRGEGKEKKEG